MAIYSSRNQSQQPDNVHGAERWISMLGGVALLATAARGGSMGRLLRGAAGVSLVTRGATGYCAMKSALQGQSSMSDGLREQWTRLTTGLGSAVQNVRSSAGALAGPTIDSMEALYMAELQELRSAEDQLITLSRELMRVIDDSQLAFRIEEYSTELQARKADLEALLRGQPSAGREHPDDAMRALIDETRKMAQIESANIRNAAIAASIQRIIHYKIAGYGAIASYAKSLGLIDQASRFKQMSERDKAIDGEITELAKSMLNPEAVNTAHTLGESEMRTH